VFRVSVVVDPFLKRNIIMLKRGPQKGWDFRSGVRDRLDLALQVTLSVTLPNSLSEFFLVNFSNVVGRNSFLTFSSTYMLN